MSTVWLACAWNWRPVRNLESGPSILWQFHITNRSAKVLCQMTWQQPFAPKVAAGPVGRPKRYQGCECKSTDCPTIDLHSNRDLSRTKLQNEPGEVALKRLDQHGCGIQRKRRQTSAAIFRSVKHSQMKWLGTGSVSIMTFWDWTSETSNIIMQFRLCQCRSLVRTQPRALVAVCYQSHSSTDIFFTSSTISFNQFYIMCCNELDSKELRPRKSYAKPLIANHRRNQQSSCRFTWRC